MQSVKTTRKSQLTLDDAIYFDHGTKMALLMFDAEGEKRLPQSSTAECETIRLYNWMERMRSSGEKTSIKTELADITAQMGKVPETREVEQSILRVRFATDIYLTKMSLGMKYIAAKLTCETYTDIQACNTTYDSWYQRLRAVKIEDVAKELGLTRINLPFFLA